MKRLFYILTAITCMGQGATLKNPVILASRQGTVSGVPIPSITSTNYVLLETGGIVMLENGIGLYLENSIGSGTTGVATNLLLESGTKLLLENGQPLILE